MGIFSKLKINNNTPITLKGDTFSGAIPVRLGFMNELNNLIGYISMSNDGKVYVYNGTVDNEIALKNDLKYSVESQSITITAGVSLTVTLNNIPSGKHVHFCGACGWGSSDLYNAHLQCTISASNQIELASTVSFSGKTVIFFYTWM